MTTLVYPLNLCIFCFKSIVREDNIQINSISVHRFLKLLKRFIYDERKTTWSSNPCIPSSNLQCCKDCETFTKTFCEIYHEKQCLELKLVCKLETLMKVMNLAEKVPSRKILLHNAFVTEDSDEDDVANTREIVVRNFENLRKEIQNKCSRSTMRTWLQPRVLLRKMDERGNTSNKNHVKIEGLTNLQDTLLPNFDAIIGWLLSFAAVSSLISFDIPLSNMGNFDRLQNFQLSDDENEIDIFTLNDVSNPANAEVTENSCEADIVEGVSGNEIIHQNLDEQSEESNEEFRKLSTHLEACIYGTQTSTSSFIQSANDQNEVDAFAASHKSRHKPINTSNRKKSGVKRKLQKPFTCSRCKMKFTVKRALKNHIKRRHRRILPPRSKIAKMETSETSRFLCRICKTTHATYYGLRSHKNTFSHRYLERQTNHKIKIEPKLEVFQQIPNEAENQDVNTTYLSGTNSFSIETDGSRNIQVQNSTETRRYNLRALKKTSFASKFNFDDDPDQSSDSDTNYINSYTNSTSDSDTSDSEKNDQDSDTSESSHDENYVKDGKASTKKRRFYYCNLDDCTFKKPHFTNHLVLKEHQKLHQRSKFNCKFCAKWKLQ